MERQFGPYRLVRQVAVGGMAEIHLAKARGIAGFEKYVALKMIHPNFAEDEQFIEMLVDEAKIAVQLTHHNIAQTFDLGRVGDTYYISMEYVDGADLYKVLRRASEQDIEFPLDVCAFIAKEVASGLDYAHRKRDVAGQPLGIVHRDVSPQNVLVSYAGEVKLVDFGIAKATMKVKQTAAGVIKGKYYYMSPEQASGGRVDARSDIFSAGIVLYEMLTGQMLYLEEDLHRLLDMVRRADIAPPSKLRRGIPPQLERIVMHALAKTAPDRYQSGADMASDLERFLHAYSPVFTPAKVVNLLRQAVGDATLNIENPETNDAIAPLDGSELMRAPGEMRDSNSVIFRVKPRPLSEGFPHIDTNAATDGGQHGALADRIEDGGIEVEEMAGGGTRSADAQRVEPSRPPEPRKERPPTQLAPPRPPTQPPPEMRRPDPPRRPEDKPAIRAPSKDIPRVRQPTAPLPSSDGIPRRSPSQPTRPVPSGSAPPPARPLPSSPPITTTKRGMFEDTRELPNDFEDDNQPITGVIDPPMVDAARADQAAGAPSEPTGASNGAGGASSGAASVAAGASAVRPADKSGANAKPGAASAMAAASKAAAAASAGPAAAASTAPAAAAPAAPTAPAASVMPMYGLEDMEGGDSTMVSQIPNFYTETGEVENTFVNATVPVPEHTDYGETQIRSQPLPPSGTAGARGASPLDQASKTSSSAGGDDEDGPTIPSSRPATSSGAPGSGGGARPMPQKVGKPAALAAKNPTPAVSELRRPRPSRSTPAAGVPNVLQAIVAAPGSEPMPPTPRRAATPPPIPTAASPTATPPPMPAVAAPSGFEPTMTAPHTYMPSASPHQGGAQAYNAPPPPPPYAGPMPGMGSGPIPASGAMPAAAHSGAMPAMQSGAMPAVGMPNDPSLMQQMPMQQPLPQQFSHLSGQFPMQPPGTTPNGMGAVMMYPPGQQPYANGGYPMMQQMQSGAFPQGQPTATGRLRALEVDEIPPHYRIKREGPRWFVLVGIALTAVATAASVTFLVLRANRQQAIASAAIRLESFPPGAVVTVDGNRLADPTPLVFRQVRPSGRYKLTLELPRHKPYTQEVSIPSAGGEVAVTPTLQPITGRLRVITEPPGADVFINQLPRGKTPVTIPDLDMDNVKSIDIRHPRCDPFQQNLTWPESGNIDLDLKLTPVASR